MIRSKYKFDTLQIHAGSRPDPSTGARQVPIYQNTAYVFKSILHAEALFDLKELGHIYILDCLILQYQCYRKESQL